MITKPEAMPAAASADEIIRKVERVGVSYVRLGGSAVLNDGTWLQPEQWKLCEALQSIRKGNAHE